jgi:hypothetical protein
VTRSPSPSELAPLSLAAVVDGVWTGALAAAVTGSSGPALIAFSSTVVFAAAAYARRAALGQSVSLPARALALAMTVAVAALLAAAGRAWDAPQPFWLLMGDLIFAALLVTVGISIGRERLEPGGAVRRAARAFAVLCCVLAAAALIASPPAWATSSVVAVILAGALLVAVTRHLVMRDGMPREHLAPAWPWLLVVAGVVAIVVVVAGLVSLVVRADVVLWAVSLATGGARYLLEVLGFVVSWLGAGLIGAGSWLLDVLDLSSFHREQEFSPRPFPHFPIDRAAPVTGPWDVARLVITGAAVGAAVVAPLAVVVLALRRMRRGLPREVVEERETIASVRSVMAARAARLGRRLQRLAWRRPPAAATPADAVRRRYAELERQLARAGMERSSGTTVRVFLERTGAARLVQSDEGAELAAIYERARYSRHDVDVLAADRFAVLAGSFASAATSRPAAST